MDREQQTTGINIQGGQPKDMGGKLKVCSWPTGHHVYILPSHDRTRVKIGHSRVPLGRISDLLDNHPEIDLSRAALIQVDSPRIERVLHTVFESCRDPLEERVDGYTEWFSGDLVDDVVDFCQTIARKRCDHHYSVQRNLEPAINAYRSANPQLNLGKPSTTPERPRSHGADLLGRLTDEALDRVDDLIAQLRKQAFDGVLSHGGCDYLVRTVRRYNEPEVWHVDSRFATTAWGQEVLNTAFVRLEEEPALYLFRLLDYYPFHQIDLRTGYEIFRVIDTRPRPPEAAPITQASQAFRQYVDTLDRLLPEQLQTPLLY